MTGGGGGTTMVDWGIAGVTSRGIPAAAAASEMAAWAAVTSAAVGFSSPQFSQTQIVRPSLVVTAWQLLHETGLGFRLVHHLSRFNIYTVADG